jgi:hypothetical protein
VTRRMQVVFAVGSDAAPPALVRPGVDTRNPRFDSAKTIANDLRFPWTRPERSRVGDPLGTTEHEG